MSAAIRDQITRILNEAKKLAHESMSKPLPERDYLIRVGKYQQMVANAQDLRARFLEEDKSEEELPEFPEDELPIEPVDRVTAARRAHRPRSY